MKFCPNCKANYPDDANFCPQESCATPNGPRRLHMVAAAPPASHQAPQVPSNDGKGRFQLGPRLGGGSTGEVYRATDSQTGAQVAYKIVNSDVLPNPATLARAERELKQLMRVQSPRIASVIDSGRTADERLYVALELVEGEPLDRLVRHGLMGLGQAKAVVAQVGQALLEAQKAGIVHRDVSPKNILVGPTGDVKVINFPIAKPLNDKASGVAAYLSPEQVQGKPVDQRSNTYSLAAVFYHLITGEPPFQGTPETVMELHVSSPPLAPSQRRPEAALSPEVDRVVLKALDKSSSRRHLTLRLFLSEVDALVAPEGAPAAGAATGKDAPHGFAKTMLFAGGQAEVANLVAKAIASRTGSPATGVPLSTPPAAAAPAPAVRRVTPSATPPARPPEMAATTEVNRPVAGGPMATNGKKIEADFGDRMGRLTPPPVTPYPPMAAPPSAQPLAGTMPLSAPGAPAGTPPAGVAPAATAAIPQQAAAGGPPGKGGASGSAFRETLWFKKGDVEHMIAEARAKMAAQGAKPGAVEGPEVPAVESEVVPVEDRYKDDGSVTTEDRKKFSLRTGGTATALPTVKPGMVPGDAMTEQDVIREVSGSRRGLVLAVAAIVVLAVVAVVAMMIRGRPRSPAPAQAPAASAIPAPPAEAAANSAAASPPDSPARTTKQQQKVVAAPPSGKRSDGSDKRASRRKTTGARKRK
jgi:eukaryotic-like serine/threonine-protein kinase